MNVLGVIPARGGSKGVPRKNLAPLGGVPLLVHTLRTARAAETLDRVVVSTDDEEIAAVADGEGIEVVRRPAELARDDSPTEDALLHVLEALGAPGPDYVVTLEPTSPFRTPALVDACVRRAVELGADALITVAETRDVLGTLDGDRFVPFRPGEARRRQLRSPLYRESSTVYVTRTAHLRSARSVLADPLYAVVAPDEEALDVNDAVDLALAEALLAARTG